jgi:tRNA-splicing ligase RtcB
VEVPAMKIVEEAPYRFRIEPEGPMRVPGVVFVSRELLPDPASDRSLQQVADVATLPGIVRASYAMPDVHWGYGFPIGGVAATDIDADGVVSPGGVGFDISCGVRLLAAPDLHRDELAARLLTIMDRLDHVIPRGVGHGGVWRLHDRAELDLLLTGGARYAVERGHGVARDLDRCEDAGAVSDADPAQVSSRAAERGLGQVGSLGSGNHFLEVQAIDHVYDATAASAMGLQLDQVCVMIHCGSRGSGPSDLYRSCADDGEGHGRVRHLRT